MVIKKECNTTTHTNLYAPQILDVHSHPPYCTNLIRSWLKGPVCSKHQSELARLSTRRNLWEGDFENESVNGEKPLKTPIEPYSCLLYNGTLWEGELENESIKGKNPWIRKFRWKMSVEWYSVWYFFGTENKNGIELYHLQNTGKFFAFSRREA